MPIPFLYCKREIREAKEGAREEEKEKGQEKRSMIRRGEEGIKKRIVYGMKGKRNTEEEKGRKRRGNERQ